MHTLVLEGADGEVRVHHSSDWSGDAYVMCQGREARVPAWAVSALLARCDITKPSRCAPTVPYVGAFSVVERIPNPVGEKSEPRAETPGQDVKNSVEVPLVPTTPETIAGMAKMTAKLPVPSAPVDVDLSDKATQEAVADATNRRLRPTGEPTRWGMTAADIERQEQAARPPLIVEQVLEAGQAEVVRTTAIREAIDAAELSMLMAGDIRHAIRRLYALVPCPECGAAVGVTCANDDTRAAYGTHQARLDVLNPEIIAQRARQLG
jgi:hypothetical protein